MKKTIEIREDENSLLLLKKLAVDAKLSFSSYITEVLFKHSKTYTDEQ